MMKNEELRKGLEITHSTDKLEDDVKKLQTAWEDLRLCFQAMPSYNSQAVRTAYYNIHTCNLAVCN